MNHANRYTFSALALGIAGVLAFGQAQASGFQLRESSVKNVGRAFSGMAVADDDASVVVNNPAAMVNLDQTTVQVDVTVIDLDADFSGGGNTRLGTPLVGGDGGDPGDPTAVPQISAVFPMHDTLEGLTIGASIGAPFGLATEYDPNWVGRYNAVKSEVKTVDFTLSAALQLHERFSVGLGVIYERSEVTLSNALDLGSLMAMTGVPGTGPQSHDGFASVEGEDNSFGWLAGFQWKPTDKLSIGFSHRSEIDHDLEGDMDFTTPATFQAAQEGYRQQVAFLSTLPADDPRRALIPTLTVLGNGFVDSAVTSELILPQVDTLSFKYQFSDTFRMMADAQWTGWSSLAEVNIDYENPYQPNTVEPFDWNDTWLWSLGAEWDINERFTLRGGFALDESPTHIETRTPRLPDHDRKIASIGMTWRISDAFSVDAAYQRIDSNGPNVNVESSSASTLQGHWDVTADLFAVAAQYRF